MALKIRVRAESMPDGRDNFEIRAHTEWKRAVYFGVSISKSVLKGNFGDAGRHGNRGSNQFFSLCVIISGRLYGIMV